MGDGISQLVGEFGWGGILASVLGVAFLLFCIFGKSDNKANATSSQYTQQAPPSENNDSGGI